MMPPRAAELIRRLDLTPHPEGGYYRQLYKSGSLVTPADTRGARRALTTIVFLLPAGEISRWHRVASDEVWHFYEGAPLALFTADPDFAAVSTHHVGPVSADATVPVHVVDAHAWQAARSTGDYTLVGCTVGPGFEFADFQMLRDRPDTASTVRRAHPTFASLID